MSSVKELLAKRKPAERKVRLLLDGTIANQLNDLRRELKQTQRVEKLNDPGLATKIPILERRILELSVTADEAADEFIFQAIPRARLDELKRQFPPTEAQWERYRELLKGGNYVAQAPEFDWVGLAPHLLAEACVEPKMTDIEAVELWDTLSDGEAAQLFEAAWNVNTTAALRPFSGTGTVTTPNSGPDSTTQQNGASPSLSLAEGS